MKLPVLLVLLPLAACAGRPAAVVEAPPPPPAPVAAPMPAGAVPGMTIPARLADGSWPTPSHGVRPGTPLSADGATWHLRAALNVAALACRDDALVAGYNAMLAQRRTELSKVEARYAAEWQAAALPDWRDAYDDAMTRVYNFYGQSFARAGFCAAAAAAIAELSAPDAAGSAPEFAADRHLAALDRPFTAFFSAYAAWKSGTTSPDFAPGSAPAPVVLALAAPVSPAPPSSAAPAKPVLRVDPAVLAMP